MSVRAGIHEKGTLPIYNLLKNTRKKPTSHKVGAIAMFIGTVRGETKKGEIVKGLEIQAYKKKADEVLESISTELQAVEGIIDVQIHHFIGRFNVGEDLVYVLVAGSHRSNVFPVLEEAIERFKKEAPIFKKEIITDSNGEVDTYWISEREEQ